MILFETERLTVRRIENKDKKYFTELFTNPRIIEPIPQKACTESQITDRFNKNLNLQLSDLNKFNCSCGIYEKRKY